MTIYKTLKKSCSILQNILNLRKKRTVFKPIETRYLKDKDIDKCVLICRQNNKHLQSNTTKLPEALEREHHKNIQKVFSTIRKRNQPWGKANCKNHRHEYKSRILVENTSFHKFKRPQTEFYVQSSLSFNQPM